MHDGSPHGAGGFLPEQSQRARPLYSIFSSRLYPVKKFWCQQIPSGDAGLNILGHRTPGLLSVDPYQGASVAGLTIVHKGEVLEPGYPEGYAAHIEASNCKPQHNSDFLHKEIAHSNCCSQDAACLSTVK